MIDTTLFRRLAAPIRRLRRPPAHGGAPWGPGSQAGFTLIEVLVATVVLTTGLVATLGLLNVTVRTSRTTLAREGGTSLAREVLEDARTIPYAQLSPSSLEGQLQAQNGLTNATPGAGWHITRRGVTYTVSASECAIDDPKDGYGVHETENGKSVFCPESTTEGTEDKTPADMKRITATVTWTIRGRSVSVTQVQTLTATGEAIGLSASELRLTSPSFAAPKNKEPVITESATTTLSFAVKAPEGTTAIDWSLEGVRQSPAPIKQSGTEWTFSWTISEPLQKVYVSDGTYIVSAQAINSAGVYGPQVSIPVTLIRGTPAAPASVQGGFNSVYAGNKPFGVKVAELQWQGNSERNVIGYRVHSPAGALVCPESAATLSITRSCIDFNPPAPSASSAERTYTVTALYRNAEGTVVEGPATKFTLPKETTAPNAPPKLELKKNEDGSVTLTWPEPPAGGPAVAFYRIYRGSHDYTERYGVEAAGTSTVTFTDDDAVEPHAYWVSAVDENLTESELVGPVEG